MQKWSGGGTGAGPLLTGAGSVGGYDGKIAGLYDLEATLGRGHFAVVKLARHVFTGEKVAVKVIDKSKLDPVSKQHLFQEVRCMKLVQHPNVVRLYEVIDTQTKLYLVLELGDGGDLYDYIMRHEAGLSEPLAREYFRQIVRAISYCHRLHVVHRDLKPENVVFFERAGLVKLTDFGFSNKFCPGQKLETSCGSLAYSAPEILLGDSYDAPAVDVWSLGVILYMLVCGQAPFQEANDSETLTMIMDCKYTVPAHVSEDCRALIGRMLVRQPERRATLEQIAADPWVALEDNSNSSIGHLPLVSRQRLSEADHKAILHKMVNGNICTKEEIVEALEKNEYNYITATYYLLAERKLRSMDPKQTPKSTPIKTLTPVVQVQVDSCSEIDSSVPNSNILNLTRGQVEVPQPNPRTRKCSIVTEDDEEEVSGGSRESGGLNRRGSRSEGKLHLAVQEIHKAIPINSITEASTAPGPLHPNTAAVGSHTPVRAVKTLPSPISSSNSLNSPQLGLNNNISRYERRNKLRKGSTASCSSSDASDEDSEGRNKRKAGSGNSLHRFNRGPQDPGAGAGGGTGGSGGAPPPGGPSTNGGPASQNGTGAPSPRGRGRGDTGGSSGSGGGTTGGGGGRRRGETRLRESQSLNRITEVQEVEAGAAAGGGGVVVVMGGGGGGGQQICVLAVQQEQGSGKPGQLQQQTTNKTHGTSKRTAFIGRYLMLHRKLCLPLLGKSSKSGQMYRTGGQDINQNTGNAGTKCTIHQHDGQGKCCSLC